MEIDREPHLSSMMMRSHMRSVAYMRIIALKTLGAALCCTFSLYQQQMNQSLPMHTHG